MQRVLVLGCSGTGKSTFARRLGAATGLPLVHLDAHYWTPGWVGLEEGEWQRVVADLVAREAWIMDGNYAGTLDVRLPRADTIIVLDLPRRVAMWSILKRVVRYLGRTRPDLAPGCPERLDLSFLAWVWGFKRKVWPSTASAIEAAGAQSRVVTLHSRREMAQYVAQVSTAGSTAV